jgi:peptidoglycan/xylan/chitin deacetylase (PgdA/CDA1 family)
VFAIAAGGHEVAAHGDLHERLVGLDSFEEAAVLDRSFTTLAGITGTPPRGFRAPGWELSLNTIGLLEDRGVGYDSSMFASDFHPYRPRRDDTIAEGEWTRGPLSRLWEIPVSWELDDFPAFFLRPPSFTMGRDPDAVFATWRDEFDYASRYEQDGVFTLTMHPMVIGRGPRLMMLERLLDHMSADGATFVRMHQIADACERGER